MKKMYFQTQEMELVPPRSAAALLLMMIEMKIMDVNGVMQVHCRHRKGMLQSEGGEADETQRRRPWH
jgi:hypothetical protein